MRSRSWLICSRCKRPWDSLMASVFSSCGSVWRSVSPAMVLLILQRHLECLLPPNDTKDVPEYTTCSQQWGAMIYRGRVWKYGDAVNTDVIFPGKYTYTVTNIADMAQHALEDLDPTFAGNAKPGDIVVGGSNWGCGSSREQAVTCLVQAGIKVLVAKS